MKDGPALERSEVSVDRCGEWKRSLLIGNHDGNALLSLYRGNESDEQPKSLKSRASCLEILVLSVRTEQYL
jgi:hypothetical protein